MQRLSIIFLLVTHLSFYGCQSNKTPEELEVLFYQNKDSLDLFTNTLKNDMKLDSIFSNRTEEQGFKFFDIKKTHQRVYNLLTNAGITEASSHKNEYSKTLKWYWLKTNWPNEYPIYLAYDIFDSVQTVKGFYDKDEVSNETWGLGDHWFMFRWVKDKPYKQ